VWQSGSARACPADAAVGAVGGVDSGDGVVSRDLLFLIRLRGGVEIAAMALMLLGTQWYILFNVIAGAMAIPTDLKEAASIFRFSSLDRWR